MTDDDPLDLAQVSADDTLIAQLQARSLEPSDPVVALLRDLLADVETDLPDPAPVPQPVGRGSTVLALAGDHSPDRRLARKGTVVAVLTAGVMSIGGMAAASTVENPSHPLHGLGEAVRSAASAVVQAVTPPSTPPDRSTGSRDGSSARTGPAPAAEPAPAPGRAVSAAARSEAALRQVDALLDEAEQLLATDRAAAASARLETAESRLRDVLPDQRQAAAQRLSGLRERVAAATASAPRPAREQGPAQAPPAKQDQPRPAKQPEQAGQPERPGQSKDDVRREQPQGASKGQQDESSAGRAEPAEDAGASQPSNRLLPESRRSASQSARVASTKPRA